MIGNPNHETIIRINYYQLIHKLQIFVKLLLTNHQLMLSYQKLLSKIIKSRGFPGRLLGPLLKTGLHLIRNIIKPLAKSILVPLGLTATATAADSRIHKKKILASGNPSDSTTHTTTLIISNDEMKDMKIVKSLEGSGLFLKGVSETIQIGR